MQHNGRTIGKFAQTIVQGGSAGLGVTDFSLASVVLRHKIKWAFHFHRFGGHLKWLLTFCRFTMCDVRDLFCYSEKLVMVFPS
jgi:hypothetical protein